jgi:hypothetical protein
VTSYLVEHAVHMRSGPFLGQLIDAAVQVRAAQPGGREIYQKVGVTSRSEAIARANDLQLL